MKNTLILLFFVFLTNTILAANKDITSSQNWSTAGIASGDVVYISNGAILTVDNGTAQCAAIYIGQNSSSVASNGTLSFNNGSQLTVSGDCNFNASSIGTIDMTNGGTFILRNFSPSANATAVLTHGTGTIRTNNNATYTMPTGFTNFYHLIVASTARTNKVEFTSAVTINGNLTLNSNAWLRINNATFTVTGTSDISGKLETAVASSVHTYNNNVTINNSGHLFTNSTGTSTINGNLTLNGGTIGDTLSGYVNHTISVSGTLTCNSGKTCSVGAGSLTVTGVTNINGTLNFLYSTTGTKTFSSDLNIASTGAWNNSIGEAFTIGGNIDIDGTISAGTTTYTLSGTTISITGSSTAPELGALSISGTCTLNTDNSFTSNGSISGVGTLNLSASKTLNCAGAITITNADFSQSGSTVAYKSASGSANIKVTTYYNLTIDKGTGSGNLQTTTTNVTNNLVVTSGTFSMGASGTRTLNVGGTTDISGAVTGTATLAGTKTFTGDFTLQSSGSITLSGTAANNLTFAGNVINNGTWTNTSSNGTTTFSGTGKAISGNEIQMYNGSITGTITNNGILTVNGAMGGAGSLTQGSGSTLTLKSTFTTTTFDGSTNSNTVNYSGSGVQTVKAEDYYNLTINDRAAAVTLSNSANITVKGTYTDNVTSGSYTTTGSTVVFNGTATSIAGTGTNTSFNNLSISSGTLTGLSGTVNIAGDFTNNGTSYAHSNGTLVFNKASGTQTLSGSGTTNLYDVLVSHATSGGLTFSSGTYNLYHSLEVASNTNALDLGTNLLTLKSTGLTNDETARIGDLSTVSTFSGSINLERYISGNTTWRQMGTCIKSQTLDNWEDPTNFPMSGSFTGATGTAGGFTSVYLYDETLAAAANNFDAGWVEPTNITNPISPDDAAVYGRGFTVYVGQTSDGSAMNPFTNTLTGTPITGSFPVSLTNGIPGNGYATSNSGFNVIANPYPSQIDLSTITWGPDVEGYYTLENGSYVWYDIASAGILPQGNAIMVFANADANITLTESNKTNGGGTGSFMRELKEKENNLLSLNVSSDVNTFKDKCEVKFIANADNKFVTKSGDIRKINSPEKRSPRISTFTSDGIRMIKNIHNDFNSKFYIPLEVYVPESGNYYISGEGIYANGNCLVLVDKETGIETDLTINFNYKFTADKKTTFENRFAIINKKCGYQSNNVSEAILRVNNNSDNLEIGIISENNINGELQVYSINGQLMYHDSNYNSNDLKKINVKDFTVGIYIVKFVSNELLLTEKVIIK